MTTIIVPKFVISPTSTFSLFNDIFAKTSIIYPSRKLLSIPAVDPILPELNFV